MTLSIAATAARRSAIVAASLFAMSSLADAHTGAGHVAGFLHPFTGLDHLLAMVAVGLFAARLGGRALWAVPLSFVGLMAAGGTFGVAGFSVPYVETIVALSVMVLGLAALIRRDVPVAGASALVGLFALFHGIAHGLEMPVMASPALYAAGFIAATALLHAIGIGAGLALQARLQRIGGAAIALAGAAMLAGIA